MTEIYNSFETDKESAVFDMKRADFFIVSPESKFGDLANEIKKHIVNTGTDSGEGLSWSSSEKELISDLIDIIQKSSAEGDLVHAVGVYDWTKYLTPHANKDLLIASIAHDIERALHDDSEEDRLLKSSDYDIYKKRHARRSSEYVSEILKKKGFDDNFIKSVKSLISNHEVGGTPEENILRDADSIAYFNDSLSIVLDKKGEDSVLKKMQYMYLRSSNKAKALIKRKAYDDPRIRMMVQGL